MENKTTKQDVQHLFGLTPEHLAKVGTEAAHQKALFAWAAICPYAASLRWMHAIPNGERRDAVTASRLKAQGVKSGVSDIFLPLKNLNYSGLYLELKRPNLKPKTVGNKGGLTKNQIAFAEHVMLNRFRFEVCYGWEEAREVILDYLANVKPKSKD